MERSANEKARLLQKIADLTLENKRLKEALARYEPVPKNTDADHEIIESPNEITLADKYKIFTSMFVGRSDVFSKRPHPNIDILAKMV